MKIFGFIFVSILILAVKAENINVSLYYESLCPYSIKFIVTQLNPGFEEIGSSLNLELVPYGNAKSSNSSGSWKFQCQHGEPECLGNRVHGCALDLYPIDKTLEFIACASATDSPTDEENLKNCAEENGLSWSILSECLNSERADELFAINGDKTHAVSPRITVVPCIIFNGVKDDDLSDAAEYDFLNVTCSLFKEKPSACPN